MWLTKESNYKYNLYYRAAGVVAEPCTWNLL